MNHPQTACLSADSVEVFAEGSGALPSGDFLKHFAGFRAVRHPLLSGPSPEQLANADKVLAGCFDIVGEAYCLPRGFSWKHNPSRDKEWQIAHHKFYFAVDLALAWRATGDGRYLERWQELISSWLDEMGTGFITASDAQVEAKRVEHWVTSFLLLEGNSWTRVVPGDLLWRFITRIGEETDYLTRHLRRARNHRTFQLYTVFLVGVLFPEFKQAAEFVELGKGLLTENLLHDFGTDGVHVELSSHYHNITLETALAFVDLARLNGIALDPRLLERLHRACEFSLFMHWPDGEIPLISDSDNGEHLPMLRLGSRVFSDPHLAWGGTRGREGTPTAELSRHFEESGYFAFTDGWGKDPESYAHRQHVFYDCAKLGEGSHYHSDLFSFCYHLNGEQVVVDPGRYTYSADPDAEGTDWRREFKSTAYHNTVTIDGRDQTRYLSKSKNPPPGIERLDRARHPQKHGPDVEIVDKEWFLGRDSDWVWGTAKSHEYAPLHSRWFVYMRRQYLFIFDLVDASEAQTHDAVLRFHLAAKWHGRVSLDIADNEAVAKGAGWQIRSLVEDGASAAIEPGWVSKAYGVKQAAPVLAVIRRGRGPLVFCSVVAPEGADIAIARLAKRNPASGFGFEVEGRERGSAFRDAFFIHPAGRGVADDVLRHRVRLLASREGMGGRIVYACEAEPQRLELPGWPPVRAHERGHFEWSAT